MDNKKGQLSGVGASVIGLLFLGIIAVILIGAGLYAITTFQGIALTTTTTETSANESLAIPTIAGITLTVGDGTLNGVCGTITEVYNATGTQVIGLTNFTQSGCTVTNATILSPIITNATTLKYTYPYTYDGLSTSYNASNEMAEGIADTPTWVILVIIIGFVGLIISALLAWGLGRRNISG